MSLVKKIGAWSAAGLATVLVGAARSCDDVGRNADNIGGYVSDIAKGADGAGAIADDTWRVFPKSYEVPPVDTLGAPGSILGGHADEPRPGSLDALPGNPATADDIDADPIDIWLGRAKPRPGAFPGNGGVREGVIDEATRALQNDMHSVVDEAVLRARSSSPRLREVDEPELEALFHELVCFHLERIADDEWPPSANEHAEWLGGLAFKHRVPAYAVVGQAEGIWEFPDDVADVQSPSELRFKLTLLQECTLR